MVKSEKKKQKKCILAVGLFVGLGLKFWLGDVVGWLLGLGVGGVISKNQMSLPEVRSV